MNTEFDVKDAYEKDRYPVNENKIMWVGIAVLTLCAGLDWQLFQWFFKTLHVTH